MSITEHLTKKNLQLLKDTRAVVGFVNVWTSQTKIFANLKGEVRKIRSSKDLEELKIKCASLFPEGVPEDYKAPRNNTGSRPKPRSTFRPRPPHAHPHSQPPPQMSGYHGNSQPQTQMGNFHFGTSTSSVPWPQSQQHPEISNSLNYGDSNLYPPMSQPPPR